jgi:hypothetical protein
MTKMNLLDASTELWDAERELRAIIAAPGVSLSSQRAKDARKKVKEAKAAYKAARAAHDEEKRKSDASFKLLSESVDRALAAQKKKGKTAKKGGRSKKGTRRTRRRV